MPYINESGWHDSSVVGDPIVPDEGICPYERLLFREIGGQLDFQCQLLSSNVKNDMIFPTRLNFSHTVFIIETTKKKLQCVGIWAEIFSKIEIENLAYSSLNIFNESICFFFLMKMAGGKLVFEIEELIFDVKL